MLKTSLRLSDKSFGANTQIQKLTNFAWCKNEPLLKKKVGSRFCTASQSLSVYYKIINRQTLCDRKMLLNSYLLLTSQKQINNNLTTQGHILILIPTYSIFNMFSLKIRPQILHYIKICIYRLHRQKS